MYTITRGGAQEESPEPYLWEVGVTGLGWKPAQPVARCHASAHCARVWWGVCLRPSARWLIPVDRAARPECGPATDTENAGSGLPTDRWLLSHA